MPAMPIGFDSMQFAKKGDAVAFPRDMLRRYDVAVRISDDDAVILQSALERHPDVEFIKGCGITQFSVRSLDYGTKCFCVN